MLVGHVFVRVSVSDKTYIIGSLHFFFSGSNTVKMAIFTIKILPVGYMCIVINSEKTLLTWCGTVYFVGSNLVITQEGELECQR